MEPDCSDVFLAGFGGQGILLAGNLLAYAAILEGKEATFFPAYGVEKRGGAATCTVVIAEKEVGSPVIGRPSSALLFNAVSMEKYYGRVKPGGFCLVNASLIPEDGSLRRDLRLLRLPLNEMALEVGDPRLVNMIALGAYARVSRAVALESLKEGMKEILPERNHRFIPLNVRAMELGARIVSSGGMG